MKKTVILSTLLSLFYITAFSQDTTSSKFRFGASITPQYSSRIYYARKDFQWAKNIYDSLEGGKIAYSIGGFAERSLSEKMTVRVGVNITNSGFRTKKRIEARWGSQNSGGVFDPHIPDPTLPTSFYYVYNHLYLEIPFDFHYFIDKKRHFYLNLGASAALNVYNSRITHSIFIDGHEEVQKIVDNQTPYQKIGLSFQLGMGYVLRLSEKIAVDIQPRFQYYASPLYQVNKGNRANTFLYNAGLQIGVKI